jgi:hypothetical protein
MYYELHECLALASARSARYPVHRCGREVGMVVDHATVTAPRSHTEGRQREPVLVLDAIEAFLSAPRCNESPNTRRA